MELHGQYGIGRYPSLCTDETCRGGVLRLGVGFSYHVPSENLWSPWVGAGLGFERLKTEFENHSGKTTVTDSGIELLNLQAGIDLALSDVVRVGPYFSAAAGMYLRSTLRRDGQDVLSGDIEQKTVHFWFQPGVRVQFRL
ncbi:hypothetical protein LY474_19500 [Myxococcus stipitatus]|uniref:hypothetical protein n=1 Tax=Myxococcus stipitatus TaxID=83455 RepID=UPI001F37D1C4|nr:hypothetical protein [Myxococcus stipitatus]MCE9669989.1 hypothetical protein [Myxococcus stipitatus]